MDSFLGAVGLDLLGFLAVFGSVFLGALVQGAVGFGLNLVIVPVMAVFRPEALPAAGILIAVPMTFGSALRERAYVDRPAILWASLGRLPAVAIGAFIVSVLPADALSLLIGGMVLLAVVVSLASPRFEITRSSLLVAGFSAGLMGTASSIGGPPIALLYQHEPGPRMRATSGAIFLVGTILSLFGLAVVGELRALHWKFALVMVPAVLGGLFASRYFHRWLDAGWLRPPSSGFPDSWR